MPTSHDPDRQDAMKRFFARTAHGIKPGLEVTQAVLEPFGHPQKSFLSIHVAGTNGKGSVCAMIESVLRAAGLKTGLYTSPHLVNFNERIRVSGHCISDSDLAALMDEVESAADTVTRAKGLRPATFFELSTVMAYEHFRRQGVEIAVIETGMGGRWDATNVLDPLIAVITGVHLDHTSYLGTDITAIAGEKAGIIKPGRPVVCGRLCDAAKTVVKTAAREADASFIDMAETISVRRVGEDAGGQILRVEGASASYGTLRSALIGPHQLENCALAVGVLEVLGAVYSMDIGAEAMGRGLASCRWPARGQCLGREPRVLLDAAHNPDGAGALVKILHTRDAGVKLGLVVGFLEDKDAPGFMKVLADAVDRCWVVPVESARSMPVPDMVAACRAAGLSPGHGEWETVWEEAVRWARRESAELCVAGSIYLAGAVLKRQWGEGGVCRWFAGADMEKTT